MIYIALAVSSSTRQNLWALSNKSKPCLAYQMYSEKLRLICIFYVTDEVLLKCQHSCGKLSQLPKLPDQPDFGKDKHTVQSWFKLYTQVSLSTSFLLYILKYCVLLAYHPQLPSYKLIKTYHIEDEIDWGGQERKGD